MARPGLLFVEQTNATLFRLALLMAISKSVWRVELVRVELVRVELVRVELVRGGPG